MSERPAAKSDPPGSDGPPIESFLLKHVRGNAGLRFGPLVRASEAACHISRRTAASHLARLLRYGDLVLLPDRTYAIGNLTAPTTRAVIEVRWYEEVFIALPDGAVQNFARGEFRVVSGRLEHFEVSTLRAPHQFMWWCTAPNVVSHAPVKRTPPGRHVYRMEFPEPLNSRKAAWQRFCVYKELPAWYRMAYTPSTRTSSGRATTESTHEMEGIDTESQSERFGWRFTSDADLRLQVVLPSGYPIGSTRCRVRYLSEARHFDSSEESRLGVLSADSQSQAGLRRAGTVLTLSVPRPVLDRQYQIEWSLPTSARRNRWLTGHRGRDAE